jgi:hypothetical protein
MLISLAATLSAATPGAPSVHVDWAQFLGRHDLVWEQFPPSWNTGGFTGNGQLGMMIYATLPDNRVDFHLGRLDVTDHRGAPDRKTSFGVPGASTHYDFPRLDIGCMALRPAGKIKSGSMRLDLWNAEVNGTIVTDLGEIRFHAFTPRPEMVDVIDVISTEKEANGRPAAWKWEFLPGTAIAPRRLVFPKEAAGQNYRQNPGPMLLKTEGMDACVQPLLAGGDYATAWQQTETGQGRGTLIISTANEVPKSGESVKVATRSVDDAAKESPDILLAAHRDWWHGFYPRSFLSIPDGRMESFYWIQLYKFASASREGGPLVDDDGPFFRINQWPYATWNLNVQLTYWLPLASNHLDLSEPLIDEMDRYFDGMLEQTGAGGNIGDLAWALHNYWLQYRYAGDPAGLREKWAPKAAMLAQCYIRRLVKGEDGELHLPHTFSPEYPAPHAGKGFASFDDSNYNLALLRWLLNSLIEISDPMAPGVALWKQTLADLTPFVVGPDGLMIAKGQPVAISHRHYSHLLALYPLFQLSPDNPADRELVDRSVTHWHRIGGGKLLAGYSFTGAASLYAALSRGNDAYAMLHYFLTSKSLGTAYMSQNTFYFESGGRNPVIETPLSAAAAIDQLLLQSWGGKLRVFPAVPDAWSEVSFDNLRGQGGFLVSAARTGGRTSWVSIKSLTGEPCLLRVADWTGPLEEKSVRPIGDKSVGRGEYEIDLKAGEQVLLTEEGRPAAAIVQPIAHPANELNLYGVKAGERVPASQEWPESVPPPNSGAQ